MERPDIDLDVTDVTLIVSRDGRGFLLRCQIVDQRPDGPARSGRHIHLTMTPKQAMELLVQLHGAQKTFRLPVPAEVTVVDVPPVVRTSGRHPHPSSPSPARPIRARAG